MTYVECCTDMRHISIFTALFIMCISQCIVSSGVSMQNGARGKV